MKNLIQLILLFCLFISISIQNKAQVKDHDREILVYIQPGYFELPEEEPGQFTFQKINTISENISRIVQDNNVLFFSKAFPEITSSDTIAVNEDDTKIKLPDMSRVFIFLLDDGNKKDILIKELSKAEGVLFAEKHVNWKAVQKINHIFFQTYFSFSSSFFI